MKKTAIRRLVVLTLCLTMVSLSLIGGTLAKYTSSFSGTDTIEIASWNISVSDDADNATAWTGTSDAFSLDATVATDNIAAGVLAPGSTGSFGIKLTNSGEVAASYVLKFTVSRDDTTNGVPSNLKFYEGSSQTALTGENGVYTLDAKNLDFETSSNTNTVVINWKWNFTDEDENKFADDTITVEVEVTATQVAPTYSNSN